MSVKNTRLSSNQVETGPITDIGGWKDVAVTVDMTGASATGVVEGSRGRGHITNVWEDLMAYGDNPTVIDNSIQRIRSKTTAYTSGTVVIEVASNE